MFEHKRLPNGDWSWVTIDGGQTRDKDTAGGHWVKRRERLLVGDEKRVKTVGEDKLAKDDQFHRRLMGWLDVDKIESWQA